MLIEKNIFEYGFYSDCLRECFAKFGDLLSLPIICDPFQKVMESYRGGKVLDIGAGKEKPIQKAMNLSDDVYSSLDNDPAGEFTYLSISEIPPQERFSLITANQVFEHISLQDSINLVSNIAHYLGHGGFFILTVPNISHPIRQRSNIFHITNWEYKALYALYRYAGLEVTEIARYSKRHPIGIIEKILASYINRIYRIDWCDSIIVVGRKN